MMFSNKVFQLFFSACLVMSLGACKGKDELISPETLYSTHDIAITESGRMFIAANDGLYELFDEKGQERPELQLITAGPDGESCHFAAIKLAYDRMYATCGLYYDKAFNAPPGKGWLFNNYLPEQIAIFEIIFNDACSDCAAYTVKSVVLPYATFPRNIDLLAPGELLISLGVPEFNSQGDALYKLTFTDSVDNESLIITSIEPWFSAGVPHGFVIHENTLYHSMDTGQSLKSSAIHNGQIGEQSHFYNAANIPVTSIISNVTLFEGKLLVTQESFTAPLFGSNNITLVDIETDPGAILDRHLLRPDIITSDAILKRIDDELYVYYVSFYNGGVYKRLINE